MHFLHSLLVLSIAQTLQAVAVIPWQSPQQFQLLNPEEGRNRFNQDHAVTRDATFTFDIDWHHGSGLGFTISEEVERSTFLQVNGSINIVAGDTLQERDVIVLVRMHSDSAELLDQLYVQGGNQRLTIWSQHDTEGTSSSATITVFVFVRPHTLQMGSYGTIIETVNLDISIWPGLYFETYKMFLTTHHGTITGSETMSFTAHEIIIRAYQGDIVGTWSLPGAINLTSHTGNIDIDLIPKRWSSGPSSQGSLHAEALVGDVTIRTPLERNTLSLRNGTTTIRSGGSISGTIVHCGQTTFVAGEHGSINVTLLAHWAFYEWQGILFNHLETEVFSGAMHLEILPPIIDSYYRINPLCLMKSYHKTVDGRMNLIYPKDWCGTASGDATGIGGSVGVSGEDYEVVIDQPQHVVVRRRPFGSQLNFEVAGNGSGYLELR